MCVCVCKSCEYAGDYCAKNGVGVCVVCVRACGRCGAEGGGVPAALPPDDCDTRHPYIRGRSVRCLLARVCVCVCRIVARARTALVFVSRAPD